MPFFNKTRMGDRQKGGSLFDREDNFDNHLSGNDILDYNLCFSEKKHLDEYDFLDFIYERPDYGKRYYRDDKTYVVTGHTPTFYINSNRKTDVYQGNGHIAIDCGCVFGGKLAAYCIETGEITYVKSRHA